MLEVLPKTVEISLDNLKKYGDPLGVGKSRAQWSLDIEAPGRGETLFYAGDLYQTMGYSEFLLRNYYNLGESASSLLGLASLLNKAGILPLFVRTFGKKYCEPYWRALRNGCELLKRLNIEFCLMRDEEPSYGAVYHTYGLLREFERHAKEVHRILRDRGVRRIISCDPIAVHMFREYYPEYVSSWDIEAYNLVEVLAEEISKQGIDLRLKEEVRVTYHDPCYMARMQGIVEEPRFLLESIRGVEFVEPERHGVNTGCTGDGGLELSQPFLAKKVSLRRGRELLSTGADLITTTCPACVMMLRTSVELLGGRADVMDLSSLVARAFTGNKLQEKVERQFKRYNILPEREKPKSLDKKDLKALILRKTSVCKYCGFCSAVCPISEEVDRLESRTPRGRMTLLNFFASGVKIDRRDLLDRLYSCALCGLCSQTCPGGLPVHEIIVYGRALTIYGDEDGEA